MALDGRGYIDSIYHRASPEPREDDYTLEENKALEENVVVGIHA